EPGHDGPAPASPPRPPAPRPLDPWNPPDRLSPHGIAELVGYGPIDASMLTELLVQAQDVTVRRLLTDVHTGAVLSVGGPYRTVTDALTDTPARGTRRAFDR